MFIVFNLLFGDVYYCTDNEHALENLREELSYWQNDLDGLTQIYKTNGYDVINPDQLTQQQLADKAMLEESIKDGRKNVKTSIESIKYLKEKNNNEFSSEQSSSLRKRANESSQTQPNKKQS